MIPVVVLALFLGWILMGKKERAQNLETAATGVRMLHLERAAGVHPRLWAALVEWQASGPHLAMVGVSGGLRTAADQLRLYAQGRSVEGNIVTNALTPQDTAHGRGGAVDVWPVDERTGAPEFDLKSPTIAARYRAASQWFRARGFVTEILVDGKVDWPHAQLADWRSLPYPPPSYGTGV